MRLKRIKKEILQISTLFILSIILIGYIVDISTPMYHLEIIKTEENGYGYRILHKNKVIIYQPYIPAINEKKTFSSEKAAPVGRSTCFKKTERRRKYLYHNRRIA